MPASTSRRRGLFAGVRGRQIAGRFTVIPATPFGYGSSAQREQWRALIATMESTLRLHQHHAGSLIRLDEYIYRRTGGMIGSLSQLIRGAAILAIGDGREQITRPLLELVPVDRNPRLGTGRRNVCVDRLAAITGHSVEQLGRALPERRSPAPDWTAWRHQPQPGCPRCDARHDGGPVQRLLPHHRYVCTRHRYWIGPPDAGQPATAIHHDLHDVLQAQRRHLRLLRRHGPAVSYDAVLTGFLICGHLWHKDQAADWFEAMQRWAKRSHPLIPVGCESTTLSASRIFAATYPEATLITGLIAAPAWRSLAGGDAEQQRRFTHEIGLRLGRPDYQPREHGDAITHWMKYDSWRPPSRPHTTFPDTREHRSVRPAAPHSHGLDRQRRGAAWFSVNRRGGGAPASPPHPTRPHPRLVTADGGHHRRHLGQPNHQPTSRRLGADSTSR